MHTDAPSGTGVTLANGEDQDEMQKQSSETQIHHFIEILTGHPFQYSHARIQKVLSEGVHF